MKVLIAYYSRTGVTRLAARAVAGAMAAAGIEVVTEEIVDTKSRKGALGYLAAGRDASLKKQTVIAPTDATPADFDVTVIGTPVWAFTMAAAVRTYCTEHAGEARKVALFCTMGGSGAERTFNHAEEVLGQSAIAKLPLLQRRVTEGDEKGFLSQVHHFAAEVAAGGQAE